MSLFKLFVKRSAAEPYLIVPGVAAWLKGFWYKIILPVLGLDFKAGSMFRVYGKLIISGPGKVRFGDNCLIISNAIKPVSIRTLCPDAVVSLGDSAGLNGTSIQCTQNITIGKLSNIADAYITDSPAHTISLDRRKKTVNDIQSYPVTIGENVWVSVNVVIIHGVTVGNNAVIGACSLVRKDVPSNAFMAGNPLKLIRNIDNNNN